MIERFARVLSTAQRATARPRGVPALAGQQSELEQWTSDFCAISEVLVARRESAIGDLAPLVAKFYRELAESDTTSCHYERSWRGDLRDALETASGTIVPRLHDHRAAPRRP